MLHLHRGGKDGKEFFMNIIKTDFGRDEITWSSEPKERRREAYKSAFSAAKVFGSKVTTLSFMDNTGKGKPVLKFVKREGDRFVIITRK